MPDRPDYLLIPPKPPNLKSQFPRPNGNAAPIQAPLAEIGALTETVRQLKMAVDSLIGQTGPSTNRAVTFDDLITLGVVSRERATSARNFGESGGENIVPGDPTAIAGDLPINGTLLTYMRSDAAPAVQLSGAAVFGLVKPDNVTMSVTGGVMTSLISGSGPAGPPGPTGAAGPAGATGAAGPPRIATLADAPPASPAVGDEWYDSVGGQLYIWFNDGTSSQWVPTSNQPGPPGAVGAIGPAGLTGPPRIATLADTPPASPTVGDEWFDTVAGQLYIRFNDGTSSQWVPTSNQPGPPGAVGAIGPTGATGAASTVPGPPGPIGATGATGAASTVPGPAGAVGATGATGAASTVPGPAGAVGATGATGAASTVPGPAGPTGAASTVPGPVGPAGSTGATGATGAASTVPGPAGPPRIATLADAPPASPAVGDEWFDTVAGQLYIWFNDGTSSQWVPTSNQPGPAGAAGAIGPIGATGATGATGAANMSGMVAGQIPVAATPTSVTTSQNLSGDVSSAPTTLVTTLSLTGVTAGTYQGLTVDAKGRVTAAVNQGYAPLASPVFTGNPTAPTPTAADNDTSIATTAFVTSAITAAPNKTITITGDVDGSGTNAITLTLDTVNANVGTFQGLTVNGKGLVTAAVNQSYVVYPAWTVGSIPFATSTAALGQDNAQLFWDDANNRMGVGTAAPAYPLEVAGIIGSTHASPSFYLTETAAAADNKIWRWISGSGTLFLQTLDDAKAAGQSALSFTRTGISVTSVRLHTNNLNRLHIDINGNVGIGTTVPVPTLEVRGTTYALPATSGAGTVVDGSFRMASAGHGEVLDMGIAAAAVWLQARSAGAPTYSQAYALLLNPNGGNVGIGTGAPGAKLTVSSNATTLPAPPGGTLAQFGAVDGTGGRLVVDTFASVGAGSTVTFRAANGTAASPSAVTSGQQLSAIGSQGYGDSAYSGGRTIISSWATENWSNTAQGAYLAFYVTANTTTSTNEAMRIDHNGFVGIGTTAPFAKLTVTGASAASVGGGHDGPFQITTGTGADTDEKLQIGVVNGSYSWLQASKPGTAPRSLSLNPNGGGVGIGTFAPGVRFQVNTSTQYDGIAINNNTNYTLILGGQSTVNDNGFLQLLNGGAITTFLQASGVSYLNGGNIGIGTAAPTAKLTVSANVSTLPAPPASSLLHVSAADATVTRVLFDAFAQPSQLYFRRANGTAAAPSALALNDTIGQITGIGYGASAYSGSMVYMGFYAAEAWTAAAQGTLINFVTTSAGTIAGSERMRITDSGDIAIGLATSAPEAKLLVVGPGQTTGAIDTSAGADNTLILGDVGTGVGNGGSIVFAAASQTWRFAAIKGLLASGSGNSAGHIVFSTRRATADATLTEAMRINNLGNVGIGSPGSSLSKLLVVSDVDNAVIAFISGTARAVRIGATATDATIDAVLNTGASLQPLIIGGSTTSFHTGGTVRALISAAGNFGIGTGTGPAAKLTVTGASGGYSGGGTDGILQVTTGTGTGSDDKLELGVLDGSYAWLQAVKPGTTTRILSLNPGGGNVGVGTIGARTAFDVTGVGSATSAYTAQQTGTIGGIAIVSGDATHTGYIGWYTAAAAPMGGTRIGYIGFDTGAADISLNMGTSVSFNILSNAALVFKANTGGLTAYTSVFPSTTNALLCGTSGNAWSAVWAYAHSTASDPSLKTDIAAAPDGALERVMDIEPKTFRWKDKPEGPRHRGFLSTDVRRVMGPDFAGVIHDDETGLEGIEGLEMTAVLWKAVQELTYKVNTLEARMH